MNFLQRRNSALSTNPPVGVDDSLSGHGSDWLWAVTAIYSVSFIVLTVFSFTAHESKRVFHYLFSVVLLVGAVAYYAQASDLGWSVVKQAGSGTIHQMFFAKYINWVVAFPSLALALGLLAGVSWTTIICNVFLSWLWVLTYLVAAYTTTDYKWGFFAFGTFAYIFLAMSTFNESHESASALGIGRDYITLSGWLNLLWVLYPVAFGLSDGGHSIGVTGGFIFFGVLDILMVPVFGFAFLLLSRNWDWRNLNLDFSEYRGSRQEEPLPLKEQEAPPTAGAVISAV